MKIKLKYKNLHILKYIYITLAVLFFNCTLALAYESPKIAIEMIDENKIYNVDVIKEIADTLDNKLSVEDKFKIVSKDEADFLIEGKVVGIGSNNVFNDEIGAGIGIGGTIGSSVHGGIGIFTRRNDIFNIAIRVNVIRISDNKNVYKGSFIGRSSRKKGKTTENLISETTDKVTDSIAKKLIKDVNKDTPKIFAET